MIEQMYDKYLCDPKSINKEWSNFFQGALILKRSLL